LLEPAFDAPAETIERKILAKRKSDFDLTAPTRRHPK
jgi:hypothetical protein